jgi:hypothetical protein
MLPNPGPNLLNMEDITQETLQAIAKVLGQEPLKYIPGYGIIEKNITTATGLVAFNLEPAAKLLVPAITPLRNMIPRVSNTRGGTAANWKVITSIDIARPDIFTAEGTKAATVSYSVTSKAASFATISKGDNFSFQAQWAGLTFEDVRARGIARLLRHVLIHEEQAILHGRVTAMTAPVAPTVTTATIGGTIAANTYYVVVRAITGLGTQRGQKSPNTSIVTSGATSTISASVPWVEGALQYEWYAGTVNDVISETLQATTQINSVLLTAYTTTGQRVDANADGAADSLAYDGVIAQLTAALAQVTTLATGTAGTGTSMQLSDADNLLKLVWDNARANPDVFFVASEQSMRITNLVLAAAGAPTLYVDAGRSGDKAELVGGYRVTNYINKVTGKPVPIVTHPYHKAGTILCATMEMPFPASDINNPIEMETRQEYLQIDYPIVAPKWEYEVMVDEVLKLFFPGSCAVLRNIAPGV